jgi:hypothetical protein
MGPKEASFFSPFSGHLMPPFLLSNPWIVKGFDSIFPKNSPAHFSSLPKYEAFIVSAS